MECLNTPFTYWTTGPPLVLMIQLHKDVETQPIPYIKAFLNTVWNIIVVKTCLSKCSGSLYLFHEFMKMLDYSLNRSLCRKQRQIFTLNSCFSQYLFLFQVHRKSCQCLPIDIPNLFLTQQFYNSCKMKMEPLYFTTFTLLPLLHFYKYFQTGCPKKSN